MKFILLLLLLPAILWANEHDLQKLLTERSQLESINSELQSEIRNSSGERDRINEKILTVQDEIKEIKRKLIEAKEKRTQFLAQSSKKDKSTIPLNRAELEASLESYESFVAQGIPWDIVQRSEKIKHIKASLKAGKEPLSESVLQWSQFLESERKLSSETQRRLRLLPIESVEHDAAVFRMGLTVLYYKTANGQTGLYYRKGPRLFHQVVSDEKTKNKIVQLVEASGKSSDRLLSELVLTPGMVN